MVVRIKVRGIKETEAFLQQVPHGTRKAAAQSYADYLIGNERHGLKHYPAYRKVTRKQVYGQTFASNKQRRWFFASLRDGTLKLPYVRTQKLRDGWEKTKSEFRPVIRNLVPYAKHVLGDDQSRMSAKIGWRTWQKNVTDNMRGALRAANQAVARWLKRNQ
jgi:hypothetical protein